MGGSATRVLSELYGIESVWIFLWHTEHKVIVLSELYGIESVLLII